MKIPALFFCLTNIRNRNIVWSINQILREVIYLNKFDKRQRLIDAAYKIFSKKGFYNASIKDIANEAEITPGLVHYYFKDKEALLFSVQDDVQQKYQNQFDALADVLDGLHEIKSRVSSDPDWYLWRYELYSLGLKNEKYKEEVASILKNGRESISDVVSDSEIANRSDAISGILLACFDGLALQKLMDDDFDLDQAYDELKNLLDNYIER